MLSTIRKRRDDEGFTLIELLVVVIIIGILAAIAIPVFLNQRENAWRSAVESDLRNAAIAIESYYTRQNAYPNDAIDGEAWSAGPIELGSDGNDYPLDANGASTVPEDVTAIATLTISEDVTLQFDEDGQTFTITGSHANLSDGAESLVYDSAAGGLSGEWNPEGGVSTTD